MVPGNICRWIIGNRVAASRLSTGIISPSVVSISTAPKTHWCLTLCPLWYFRRTSIHSSISTVWPTPPMTKGFRLKCSAHTSRMKFFQSTTVRLLSRCNSCMKSTCRQYCRLHKYIKRTTVALDKFVLAKKVPLWSDAQCLHRWHRQQSLSI